MAFILSAIKDWLMPSGAKPRSIQFGAFKGLRMNLDLRIQTQAWLGLAEREVFSYLRAFSHLAKTGIDIGAADGEYTLFFMSQPNIKHVFAFDPSERFPADLSANLALNGFQGDLRSRLIKQYVSDHDDDNHCTLDSFAVDLEGPCVVKIDVDGGEGAVLQGATKFLERKDVSWIIETHSLELEQVCDQILSSKGFSTTIIKNRWWRAFIPERRPISHNRWLAAWSDCPRLGQ